MSLNHLLLQVHIDDLGLLISQVEILPDMLLSRIPRPVREKSAFWLRWAHKPFDVFYLSSKARELYECLVPQHELVQDAHFGKPVQFSFYLASVLPLSSERQQNLLECATASERLLREIRIMSKMIGNRLSCQTCSTVVALAKDVFRMSSEGISGVFVNTHGFIHDIVTLLSIKTEEVQLQGDPETEHCWFPGKSLPRLSWLLGVYVCPPPSHEDHEEKRKRILTISVSVSVSVSFFLLCTGYAWTITNCKTCGSHLGWCFTRVSSECSPEAFWGLSRDALSIP